MALTMLAGLTACGAPAEETGGDGGQQEDTAVQDTGGGDQAESPAGGASATGTQMVVVEGFDWGPAVTKTIITLNEAVSADSVTAESFAVTESKESFNWAALAPDADVDPTQHIVVEAPRTVTAAYTCDEFGDQVSEASDRIALEMFYDPNNGSPYCYDLFTWHNTICNPYELVITLTDSSTLTAEDGTAITEFSVDASVDLYNAIMPQLDAVDLAGSFTGTDGRTLLYGSYSPADDGEKHPLVIWIHGAGEGGMDVTIPLLGNKVTALIEDEFQSAMGGAYVLIPQTPDFWLTYNENGDWQDNPGVDSIYLATLMELIEDYVAANENIDASRIYIGGCSNGGFMTMNMVLAYPDYFAAAFPICEAYADAGITDAQLAGIKDLPIWFVYAENDDTVIPENFEIPTIARLEAIGADVHTSIFENVVDTTGQYKNEDGSAYEYMGHWSWLYFFNNECEEDGVNMWDWMASQSK